MLKRLPACHGKLDFIREEIRKKEAGVRGENRILLKLSELRIPGTCYVFSDVSLILGEWKVQIDCMVVTDRCCIVIESKNISGDLYFDENSDDFFKVNPNGNEISYPNPYYQLMRHIRFMKEFLRDIIPKMKVTGRVIMTAKSCRIHEKPANYPIFKLESMIEKVLHLYNNSSPTQLSDSEFNEIKQKIIRMQSTFSYPPLCEYYKIPIQEILTGVECPHCGALGMKRTGKTWTCIACKKNQEMLINMLSMNFSG
ncbi:nuclease-related domain-containing protein [Psychrobacillus sp.]|uniref:nuclease-related domain-containing protein n=1 Tax=Psychrobacillus sp. TaxID=1871623 RepID=UPI0028BE25A2|nr:nuclease-related domain-containing protein [Psychrobacillus sp.]